MVICYSSNRKPLYRPRIRNFDDPRSRRLQTKAQESIWSICPRKQWDPNSCSMTPTPASHCCCCCCCCCCCQVASVVSNSVQPHGLQPTRLLCPWDSPGKNTGVGCHFLLQCMKVESESEVTQSCLTLSDPMDCSPPGSSIHGIFQAKYWSGVPLPSPKDATN